MAEYKEHKEEYKKGLDLKNLELMDDRIKKVISYPGKASEKDKAYSLGVASGLLKKAYEMETDNLGKFPSKDMENPIPSLLLAAAIYSSIEGKLRDSVKERMKKIVEKNPNQASKYTPQLKYYELYKDKQENSSETKNKQEGELEEKVRESTRNYTIPLLAFIGALFFLTPSLTGNIIGNLSEGGSRGVSILFFLIGLGSFLFIKLRK